MTRLTPSNDIGRLIEIMAELRQPETGCSWDIQQTFATIAPYTIEEAYEVADAIARGDLMDLKDELGDLLLQVAYHARMAEEQGAFAFGDVVEAVTAKMIRRHPHVFGSAAERAAGVKPGFWARIKAAEKNQSASAAERRSPDGVLANVPHALPALTRAIKLQDKAAAVGFDWPGLAPVFDKMREELGELEAALMAHRNPKAVSDDEPASGGRLREAEQTDAIDTTASGGRLCEAEKADAIKEEFGDLLFVMANVARHLKIDPEDALRSANRKFTRRFAHIEMRLAEKGSSPAQSSLEDMDAFWNEAKTLE